MQIVVNFPDQYTNVLGKVSAFFIVAMCLMIILKSIELFRLCER